MTHARSETNKQSPRTAIRIELGDTSFVYFNVAAPDSTEYHDGELLVQSIPDVQPLSSSRSKHKVSSQMTPRIDVSILTSAPRMCAKNTCICMVALIDCVPKEKKKREVKEKNHKKPHWLELHSERIPSSSKVEVGQ